MEFNYEYRGVGEGNPGPGGIWIPIDDWRVDRLDISTTDQNGQVSIAGLVGRPAAGNELWISNNDFPRKFVAYTIHGVINHPPEHAYQTILVAPRWSSNTGEMPLEPGDVNVEVTLVSPNAFQYEVRTGDPLSCELGEIVLDADPIHTTSIAVAGTDRNGSNPVSAFMAWTGGVITAFRADWTYPFFQYQILDAANHGGFVVFTVRYIDFTSPGGDLESGDLPAGAIVNLVYSPASIGDGEGLPGPAGPQGLSGPPGPEGPPGPAGPAAPVRNIRFVPNVPKTAPGPNELPVAVNTAAGAGKGVYVYNHKTNVWVKVA